jgi:hypothetical protein
MRFWTDDESLSLGITLGIDDDPRIDLTDGRGRQCLDEAVNGFCRSSIAERSPAGHQWAANAPSTVAAKTHGRVGYRSGQMLGDLNSGDRDIQPRSATWSYPRQECWGRAHGFHNGNPRTNQPARPLIGWTAEAQDQCRRILQG